MTRTRIVGILNITPDSFFDGGKFDSLESALTHTKQMIDEGAAVIDVGAESTRPKSVALTAAEEWARLENILPAVVRLAKMRGIKISIDSYHFETIQKAHDLGVDIINDVSGLIDKRIIDFIAAKNITTILMHNLAIHSNPNLIVNQHLNINAEILRWASEKIFSLTKKGVKKSQLIFDPGIGFSKDAAQSIRILKNIDSYRALGLPLYVGHSKKSFLDALDIPGDRAQKTLEVTKFLAERNVEFLRVHDVRENFMAFPCKG
ncbi:MAG: dihydropteroate synthase [Alphaproteobacteria bacterium]|nr:dihydropteroate synthase [Alphaproteobacteria bacterium]